MSAFDIEKLINDPDSNLDAFIAYCEENPADPPPGMELRLQAALARHKRELDAERRLGRKIAAAACFTAAAAVACCTVLGANPYIHSFLTNSNQALSAFFNTFAK